MSEEHPGDDPFAHWQRDMAEQNPGLHQWAERMHTPTPPWGMAIGDPEHGATVDKKNDFPEIDHVQTLPDGWQEEAYRDCAERVTPVLESDALFFPVLQSLIGEALQDVKRQGQIPEPPLPGRNHVDVTVNQAAWLVKRFPDPQQAEVLLGAVEAGYRDPDNVALSEGYIATYEQGEIRTHDRGARENLEQKVTFARNRLDQAACAQTYENILGMVYGDRYNVYVQQKQA